MLPESQTPLSLVMVWFALSWFVQRTVVPTLMVILTGSKVKPLMAISTVPVPPGAGVFVAAGGKGVKAEDGVVAALQLTSRRLNTAKDTGINFVVFMGSSSPRITS
jgi:hypothetical protein